MRRQRRWLASLWAHRDRCPLRRACRCRSESLRRAHTSWMDAFLTQGFCQFVSSTPKLGKDGRHLGHEILDMDGLLSACAAVMEMMAHDVNGKPEFFRGCPDEWKDVSFENIALSDGPRVRGRRLDGKVKIVVH